MNTLRMGKLQRAGLQQVAQQRVASYVDYLRQYGHGYTLVNTHHGVRAVPVALRASH